METTNDVELLLGGVYNVSFNQKPIRVIAFDDRQVYYDVWWNHIGDWGIKNSLKERVNFYRVSVKDFLHSSTFLRLEALTETEEKAYRPDLPFFICRSKGIEWSSSNFASIRSYEEHLSNQSKNVSALSNLDAIEIFLVPSGHKGGYKKSVLIKAANGKYFTAIELLWHAQNIQASYWIKTVENGVGLHRLGFENQIPSYYIGGYYDRAGFLEGE